MKIIAIAAIGKNNELGKDNDLIWRIPEDLKRFMLVTNTYPMIMGSRTFESIGRPLPNRPNIVISKHMPKTKGIFVVRGVDKAIEMAKSHFRDKCFIIGGGKIYGQYMKKGLVDELLLTQIDGEESNCCAYFPDFEDAFHKVMDVPMEHEGLKYSFTHWIRNDLV